MGGTQSHGDKVSSLQAENNAYLFPKYCSLRACSLDHCRAKISCHGRPDRDGSSFAAAPRCIYLNQRRNRLLAPVISIFDPVKSLRLLDGKSPNRLLSPCANREAGAGGVRMRNVERLASGAINRTNSLLPYRPHAPSGSHLQAISASVTMCGNPCVGLKLHLTKNPGAGWCAN